MTQPALFPPPAPAVLPRARTTPPAQPNPPATTVRTGPAPGTPADPADSQLGWAYPYVTPRRAAEIRRDIDTTRKDTP